jgi:hypothetical protein
LFAHASKSRFFSPGPSPINDHCANLARKNEPDRNFFFLRTNTQPDWTDRTLPRNPMPPVNSVLPWIVFTNPHAPQINLAYAFSIQLPSISVLAPKKIISFGLLSFTAPAQLVRGHFALLAPLPIYPIHNPSTEWKESTFSVALHSSSLRFVYIITTQFFVLRLLFSEY